MEQSCLLCVGFFIFSGFWIFGFCDQEGFLSLSCGAEGSMNFFDSNKISWISDAAYISSGNTTTINYIQRTSSVSVAARFFPDTRARNCYRLPVKNVSSLILLRATFMYKNYDKLQKPPAFSVSLGTAITGLVNLSTSDPWTEEIIWPVNKDTLSFCLHSILDAGSPIISSLEVRPLPQGAYKSALEDSPDKLLRKSYRINSGYPDDSLRYPFDAFDRIWDADQGYVPFHLSSEFDSIISLDLSSLKENPPIDVLETARVLARTNVLSYNLALNTTGDYFIILYFADVIRVSPSFDVMINEDVIQSSFTVKMSEARAIYSTHKAIKNLNITLKAIEYYPLINAIEVYEVVEIPLEASSTTVSALQVIQQSAGLDLGWEDDPCSPRPWEHIGCEGTKVTFLELSGIDLRSITPTFGDLLDLKILDLHNASLTGEIQNLASLLELEKLNLSFNQLTSFGTELEKLVSLQVLDLQNNSLEGMVPDELGKLENLHLLNLENNELQGTLPHSLKKEGLEIRTSGNSCLSFSTMICNDVPSAPSSIETPQVTIVSTKKRANKDHIAIIIGAVVGASAALLLVSATMFLYTKKRRSEATYVDRAAIEMCNWNASRVFSHKEIKSATNNFKEVIGHGSFGSVYLGKLSDGKMVAVKVRFDKTQLGADSYINEVHLLSQVRHQNLVCLEGFCYESKQQILVYEYLPGGSLADHLYGLHSKRVSLSWVRRLKIAVDAAKGLDYLHNGSQPRIIHRDIKCTNILLDKEMNAKVCDFGLSKQVVHADATHVTTIVKGTAGYLDPEYYSTQQLTEKSDVYSFGVVLLELICGREPLRRSGTPDSFNLVLWAKPYLQASAFEIVVDESLKGSFDVESMRKTSIVAIRSVERDASRRPTIAEVLTELKEAYSIQLSYLASQGI